MGSDLFLAFGREQFNKLFPFFLLIDENNKIISCGNSLKKIFPVEEGADFFSSFSLKSFTSDQNEITQLNKLQNQVVILDHNSRDIHTFLRGEFTIIPGEQEKTLFIGTPWFGSIEELVQKNLTINDFALHDPMVDLLHVLKTQEITTNEIKQLLTQVNRQKEVSRESEKRLSSLILNLQMGVLLEDDHRRIVLTNKMLLDIFGIRKPLEQMIGVDCSQSDLEAKKVFLNPQAFINRIDQIIRDKKVVIGEQLDMVDGRVMERDYIPVFVDDQYKGHLWKYTDITERKKYERDLKNQEEKYRSIIENMNLGLIEVNPDDLIQYANQSFCRISGYRLDELLMQHASKLFTSEHNQEMIQEKTNARREGITDNYEVSVRNKSGELRWWLISGAPRFNDKGEFIGSVGIHLDITEQKKLEEQLRQAKVKAEESSKAKESFLANMSHEIRTPLNAIIGMVRELSHTSLNELQQSYVGHARSASQHLLSIVNNILDISKIEAGQLQLDYRSFSLWEVLKDTETIMAPAAKEKMLGFELLFNTDFHKVYFGDPNRLRQIFINIISNAIKFTETGKVIIRCDRLEESADEESLRISITDTGIGMDPKFLKNLFKKFSQERNSPSGVYGGTGLGMAITNELLQLMNGRIEVQSKKGSGTTFNVFLTFRKEVFQPKDQSVLKEPHKTDALSIKVLLVEDSPLNRLVANNCLKRHGVAVTEAKNGREAVEFLEKENFDLVLMDMQMPVMDGIEATKYIRNELRLTVPVVALTANVFKDEIEKCMDAGMNDYIVKPFEEKLLMNIITRNVMRPSVTPNGQNGLLYSDKPLYDFSDIDWLSDGNKDFLQELIQLFSVEVLPSVSQMKIAASARDYGSIRKIVHRIKPSYDIFRITSLTEDFELLGKASDEISIIKIENSINHVKEITEEVIAKINSEIQPNKDV